MRTKAGPGAAATSAAPSTLAPSGLAAPALLPALSGPAGGVLGATWTQIGPAPLRIDSEQVFQGAGPDSGQVTDIAIDPGGAADKVIYIATNDGGIWKTTNADAAPASVTWQPLTDAMPSNSMGAVALDPGNPSIVYAGTGNQFNNGFANGIGVYRSVDGGATWTIPAGGGALTGLNITRIVLPAPNVLLVATTGGLFKSVDGGVSYGSNSPSFNNGGAVLGGFITDLHLDTATVTTVYAATNGGRLSRSTDSGSTFGGNLFDANVPAGSQYVSFSQAATAPGTMYANVRTARTAAGIFRTTNLGAPAPTWANVAAGSAQSAACQCGYDQTIGVDPQDANTIYIAFQEMYVSTDGGASFPKVSANKIHFDHHAITFQPPGHRSGTTHAWIGTDGGIHETSDKGATFANPDEGIATNLFRGIDIGRGSAANRAFTYGGTQDTGIVEHRAPFPGNDWHLNRDGDGGLAAVDPCDPNHAISSDNGRYAQTTDGAATPWPLDGHGFVASPSPGIGVELFDPGCTNAYLAANGTMLFQSTDNTANFASIHTFPASIQAIAMRPGDRNTMWVGLGDGTVARTSNLLAGTGSTWTAHTVTGAAALPIGGPGGIAVDPADSNTVIVTYEGFTGVGGSAPTRHVFRSTDNGVSWADLSGTDGIATDRLPDLPTHSVVIDPGTTPHGIIVSNDAGVLRSADDGASWQVLGVGLPVVDAVQLQIDTAATPTLLRVGTYGRSSFELTGAVSADLSITKAATPASVAAGANLTYSLLATNQGPDTALQVAVDDLLPPGVTFVSETHPAGWVCADPAAGAPGTVHCTKANLAAALAPQAFSIVVRVNSSTAGGAVITNSARIAASTSDPNLANNVASATSLVKRATVLTYDGAVTQDFHDPAIVSATLRDALSGAPIPDATVAFTLGSQSCPAITDGAGLASCMIVLDQTSGPYTVAAAFSETATLFASTAAAPFVVTREETTLTYSGDTHIANGVPAHLRAVLLEDGAVPINGRTVTFTLGSGSRTQTCSGATGPDGTATCTIDSVSQPLNDAATVPVRADFSQDGFYRSSSGSATLLLLFTTGRAIGVSGDIGLLFIRTLLGPTPDTGPVRTPDAVTVSPPCTASVGALIVTAHAVCASVVTTIAPGTSTGTASVADARIGIAGLPVISLVGLRTTSVTSCAGHSRGTTTLTALSVGGVSIPVKPGPNTGVNLGVLGASLLLNEQVAVPGADFGMTVRGLHLVAHTAVLNVDITLASATSDIHNCP